MGLDTGEHVVVHVKRVPMGFEEPADSAPQNGQAISTEQPLYEIQIEHREPAGRFDHFSEAASQGRPPEALDEGALGSRRRQDSPTPFHAMRAEKRLLLHRGRMSHEADRTPRELENTLAAARVHSAVRPCRVRCAEQLEGGVVREDGVGPDRLCHQERVRFERLRSECGRNDGGDSPGHSLQAPSAEMVFQSLDSTFSSRRRLQSTGRLIEREDRVGREELVGFHFILTT